MAKTSKAGSDGRARVVAVAKRLFTERSFEAVSMADVAEAAGLQKASLYYFFKSKEAIYAAIMADVIERTLMGMSQELARACRRPGGDRDAGRRDMARLLARFIRLALSEGTVVRHVDLAFLKDNPDLQRLHAAINGMASELLAFFTKHGVSEPDLAIEVCINAIRAYILNRRFGCHSECSSRVSPTRYANYLAGLLIK
jgi:AcrR family transcriptional regulator